MAAALDSSVRIKEQEVKQTTASVSNGSAASKNLTASLGLRGLRAQFSLLILGIYLLIAGIAFFQLYYIYQSLILNLGTGYATQFARLQQARILAKVEREVVLAQKLASSPLLCSWAKDENNPSLKKQALAELDSYRKLFSDRSVFFIINASKHYYFNDASNKYQGRELQYTVSRDDPQSSWYFDTIKKVDNFTLHVDNNFQLGLTNVWINAIVKDSQNKKVGIGGSGLDLTSFLNELVVSNEAGVSTVIIDHEGYVQGYSDTKAMEHNSLIKNESDRLKVFDLVESAEVNTLHTHINNLINSSKNITNFQSKSNGHQVIVGAASIAPIGWIALVFVDPTQVIGPLQFLPVLALVAITLLASLLLVSYAIEKKVLKRLRILTNFTQKLAAEHYSTKIEDDCGKIFGIPALKLKSHPQATEQNPSLNLKAGTGDEIGQLTSSFNYMSSILEDYMQTLELKVEERTKELNESNSLLTASNKLMVDSIHYALLIQTALLAKPKDMLEVFSDSFTYWQPRDVVGGDFYALYQNSEQEFLLAVADCTGHGVPGALMTMASKALLDRAVAVKGFNDPAQLLNQLHKTLGNLLSSKDEGIANGLDIALVAGRTGQTSICYSGARIPLWIQPPGQPIEVLKASKLSIGYTDSIGELDLVNHELEVPPGTRLFLTSDGILDQPGGERGFGLGQRRLQEALDKWENQPLSKMSEHLEAMIKSYSGSRAQRDDIVVVGVQLGPLTKASS